jgi:hypothetical protein
MTNAALTAVDLTGFTEGGVFMWQYFASVTGITSVNLKWGTDASNYYTRTVTTTVDGLPFFVGWNLLYFPWTDATQTGTVTITSIGYLQITIAKTAGHLGSTVYSDRIIACKDSGWDLLYYSKFPWMSTAGAFLVEATADTDYLICDDGAHELDMFIYKGAEICSDKLGDEKNSARYRQLFLDAQAQYIIEHPSERRLEQNDYHTFEWAHQAVIDDKDD